MEVFFEAMKVLEAEGEAVADTMEPTELLLIDPANETIERSVVFEGKYVTELFALRGITLVIFGDAEEVEISGVLIHIVIND